jgi:hypothetical protein
MIDFPDLPVKIYEPTDPFLEQIITKMVEQLPAWIDRVRTSRVVFGFDGFVDELFSVVRNRSTLDSFELMQSMKEFADRIQKTAGSATDCETILKDKRTGGFVANTCEALVACTKLGNHLTMMGNFGYPSILPLFLERFELKHRCEMITIGNPGKTSGYEFNDGKVMMTNFAPIYSIDVPTIQEKIGTSKLIEILQNAQLFGLGYWSVTPKMSEIFRYFQKEVFPHVHTHLDLFLDLADLRKKSAGDISECVNLINDFLSPLRVTISLNDKEAIELTESLLRRYNDSLEWAENPTEKDYIRIIQYLQRRVQISFIVIHTPRFAVVSDGRQIILVPNAFTKSPRFTVAAGDTFNAGFCIGLLVGASMEEMAILGNVLTSYFIRTGIRGSFDDILIFLRHYLKYLSTDSPDILK